MCVCFFFRVVSFTAQKCSNNEVHSNNKRRGISIVFKTSRKYFVNVENRIDFISKKTYIKITLPLLTINYQNIILMQS